MFIHLYSKLFSLPLMITCLIRLHGKASSTFYYIVNQWSVYKVRIKKLSNLRRHHKILLRTKWTGLKQMGKSYLTKQPIWNEFQNIEVSTTALIYAHITEGNVFIT